MKKQLNVRALVCGTVFLIGTGLAARGDVLVSEDFENSFPAANGWAIGDSNVEGTPCTWGTVSGSFGSVGAAHNGSFVAYCAAVGYGGTTLNPTYQNNMWAYMYKLIDFSGYGAAELSFWYKIPSINAGNDHLRVYVDNTNLLFDATEVQATWQKVKLDLSAYAGGIHAITFVFRSETGPTAEGAYLDDIAVTARTVNLWWQHKSGSLSAWSLDGTNATPCLLNPSSASTGWRIAATADFDGDGQTDLVWQNQDGRLSIWFMDQTGTNLSYSSLLNPSKIDPAWKLMAATDFNEDGLPDLLFHNSKDGRLSVWVMEGTNRDEVIPLSPSTADPSWKIVAVGDLNNDGHPEIVWQDKQGRLSVWFMGSTTRRDVAMLEPAQVDPKWQIVGTADINHDNQFELIWQHENGTLSYWLMQGGWSSLTKIGGGYLNPVGASPDWKVVGVR